MPTVDFFEDTRRTGHKRKRQKFSFPRLCLKISSYLPELRHDMTDLYCVIDKIVNTNHYSVNLGITKRTRRFCGKIFLTGVKSEENRQFFERVSSLPEKNTAFFQKKTKSFDSKDFVLALLTLRFFGKRRRFLTVKTPSFSGRFSICLQGVEIQSLAKPSNTRKISSKFPSAENS